MLEGLKKHIRRMSFMVLIASALTVSAASNNVYATPPASLDGVNVYLFGHEINDARSRRLIQTIEPDLIHRGIFEWIGTSFSDKAWAGAVNSIQELRTGGSFVMGGLSGRWWSPDNESGPATVDKATKDACTIQNFIPEIDIRNSVALDQLIYKAKKQIDAGVDGIEFDEYGDQLLALNDGVNYESYIKSSFQEISNELKAYAQSTYGRTVYISANANFGGSGICDGTEPVDYYIRKMPYTLVSDGTDTKSYDHLDGTVNYLPELRCLHSTVWPKRVFYWADFYGKEFYTAPHRDEEMANWYRISSANILAAGGFPGHFRAYYNTLDSFDRGIFQQVANLSKFMRDNYELWHNLTFINPTVSTSTTNIYTSTFGQTGRTILHLVNGNYNNAAQTMTAKTNFTVSISLSSQPTNIWMTTPDKPTSSRRTTLSYTYANGTATITVPELDFHNVIVIEQGTAYNPVYAPLEVKFPFPLPVQIAAGNKLKVTAVATDGFDSTFNWYVNNISGGNSTVGTIDVNGIYTAPSSVPNPDTVVIKAVSKVDMAQYNSFSIKIVPEPSFPWTDNFSSDLSESIPFKWYIVDGKGDWKVDLDSGIKVLHNYNISEGNGDADNREIALYNALIVSGNQKWSNYAFSVDAKPTSSPLYYYGSPSGSFIGLVFRYKDPENYYTYTISPDGRVRLFKTVNGTVTQIGNVTETDFIAINQYTNLKIEVYGNNFRFYVNSLLVRDDRDSAISEGGIGLKASFSDAMYKNINVQSVVQFSSDYNRKKTDPCDNFLYVAEKSANLAVDTSNPGFLYGDSGRFVRNNGSVGQEYVTYNIANKNNMQITSYFWSGEAMTHYKFYISSDNANWKEITPLITTTTGTLPVWHRVVYNFNALPVSAKYLKAVWQSSTTSWSPQIGEGVFSDTANRTVTDACGDATNPSFIFARSYDIGVDTSSSVYLGGDNERYCSIRSSQEAEWITYSFPDMSSASITTYFWPGEAISNFKFYTSSDNSAWTEVTPAITTVASTMPYWHRVVYSISSMTPGVNYLKVFWQNLSGQPWSPQLGAVSITHGKTYNMVLNPGFEAATPETVFWKLPTNFEVTNSERYLGTKALKLTTQGNNAYSTQEIGTTTNTNYTLVFYAKCEAVTNVKILTATDSQLAAIQTSANNEWTRYELNFNSGSNNHIKIYIGDNVVTPGKLLYFDEIQIR